MAALYRSYRAAGLPAVYGFYHVSSYAGARDLPVFKSRGIHGKAYVPRYSSITSQLSH